MLELRLSAESLVGSINQSRERGLWMGMIRALTEQHLVWPPVVLRLVHVEQILHLLHRRVDVHLG